MNERPTQQAANVEQGTVEQGTVSPTTTTADTTETGFLPEDRMDALRQSWSDIQTGFVDDPQNAVQRAHGLVTQLVDDLVQTFTRERTSLEQQWSGGGTADTEALRVALQRYRSFFNRLLGT